MKTRKCYLKKSLRSVTGCIVVIMTLMLYPSQEPTFSAVEISDKGDREIAYFVPLNDAVHALIGALANNNMRVKSCAVQALGEIGKPAKAAIPRLLEFLHSENISLKCRVIDALSKIATRDKAIAVRLSEILETEEGDVKAEATRALGNMQAEFAVLSLINALEDRDGFVRENAARSLGELKAQSAVNALINALHDEDCRVQAAAALSLGKIRPSGQIAISALIAALDEPGDVKYAAVNSLGEFGASALPAAPILLEFLEYGETRDVARKALVKIGSSHEGVALLIEAFHAENEDIRIEIAQILGNMKNDSKKIIPVLAAALDDEGTGEMAACSLALFGEKAVPILIDIIDNGQELAKCNAALALGKITRIGNRKK